MRLLPVFSVWLSLFLRQVVAVEVAATGLQDASRRGSDAEARKLSTDKDSARLATKMRREALPASAGVPSQRRVQVNALGEITDASNEESADDLGSADNYHEGYAPSGGDASAESTDRGSYIPAGYAPSGGYAPSVHAAYAPTRHLYDSHPRPDQVIVAPAEGYAPSAGYAPSGVYAGHAGGYAPSGGYAGPAGGYVPSGGYAGSAGGSGYTAKSSSDYAKYATYGSGPAPMPTPMPPSSIYGGSAIKDSHPQSLPRPRPSTPGLGKPASRQELSEAEMAAAKFQRLEYRAEQKAGLPDTIYTSSTVEPAAEREAAEEETSLAYAAVSMAVILACVAIFSSLYTQEQLRKQELSAASNTNARTQNAPAPQPQAAPTSGALGGWGGW